MSTQKKKQQHQITCNDEICACESKNKYNERILSNHNSRQRTQKQFDALAANCITRCECLLRSKIKIKIKDISIQQHSITDTTRCAHRHDRSMRAQTAAANAMRRSCYVVDDDINASRVTLKMRARRRHSGVRPGAYVLGRANKSSSIAPLDIVDGAVSVLAAPASVVVDDDDSNVGAADDVDDIDDGISRQATICDEQRGESRARQTNDSVTDVRWRTSCIV